jgi:hypothetical protein
LALRPPLAERHGIRYIERSGCNVADKLRSVGPNDSWFPGQDSDLDCPACKSGRPDVRRTGRTKSPIAGPVTFPSRGQGAGSSFILAPVASAAVPGL